MLGCGVVTKWTCVFRLITSGHHDICIITMFIFSQVALALRLHWHQPMYVENVKNVSRKCYLSGLVMLFLQSIT